MKKIAMISLTLAGLAFSPAAFANDPSVHHTTTEKRVELQDGSWVQISSESVKVSKDGGKTWETAPDGTWDAKDGTTITTKDGRVIN